MGYHTYADIPLDALVDGPLARCPADAHFDVDRPAFPHGMGGRGDDRSRRHRLRGERPDGGPRQDADRLRHGRLPVHRDGHRAHRAGRARLLRDHGLRRAGRPRRAGGHRTAAADPGRRRRLPDDRGLGNCRRYGWDPIVLLFNNASWEMLRTFQPESGFNDLDDWGFAQMAAGLGETVCACARGRS